MRYILSILSCLLFLSSFSQRVIIYGMNGVNSLRNELFCYIHNGELVFASDSQEDLVSDTERSSNRSFQLFKAEMKDDLTQYRGVRHLELAEGEGDIGPLCIDPSDSSMYFSASKSIFSEGRGVGIYHVSSIGEMPTAFAYNKRSANVMHPYISESGDKLLFSSNQEGGKGGMDIWFCVRESDGSWSSPLHLDSKINSSSNEIFPIERNGDIYFASNREGGYGGYDVYKATKSSQWREIVRLEPPLNSNRDDLQIYYFDDLSGFLCSSREGGEGGDDLYFFEIIPPNEQIGELSALLSCKGTGLYHAQIKIFNSRNELIRTDSTDEQGYISLAGFPMNHEYKMKVEGVDPDVLENSLLHILDESGRKIRVYRFNRDGFFVFEMLPFDHFDHLDFVDNQDGSVLSIELQGQIFVDEPGDVGEGEAIYTMDESGELMELSYTDEEGNFSVNTLTPKPNYTFRVDEALEDAQIVIEDHGESHQIQLDDGQAKYERSSESKGVEIVDENNEQLWLDSRDVFVVNKLYYELNSSYLTESAKIELDKLVLIMKNNPEIHVVLSAHTDSRGDDGYNMDLSEKRAKRAMTYVLDQGVEKSRIDAEGHGESQLLNDCGNGASCPEEMHSLNRRTEISIYLGDIRVK